MRKLYGAVLVALLVTDTALAASGPTPGPVARYAIEGKFEDVRDDLRFAIQARGLVVDHVSHIQAMLDRTGKDLGAKRRVFQHAQALSFCSAVVSRRMMEADAHHIAFCPYVISVYTLAAEPDHVYVAFRRPRTDAPGSEKALREVEALLDDIVREALDIE